MHCLLTALGSYGDVYPMIALATALRKRGHDVTLVTNPYFAEEAASTGADYAPIGTAEDYVRLTKDPRLWRPLGGGRVVVGEVALGILDELYETVRGRCRPGETVLAAHGLDLASRLVAEREELPAASIVYAPVALWSGEQPPRMPVGLGSPSAPRWLHRLQYAVANRVALGSAIVPKLNRFRATIGLPPIRGTFVDWYYRVAPPLALFPDWFVAPDGDPPSDWPARTVTTGFPLGDGAAGRDAELEPAVEEFLAGSGGRDDAPLVFTPGSAMRYGERFFAAAADACRRLDRRGVFLTKYPEQLPDNLPETILAPGFTPLARLLPRSAAFVHHGGIGSSARGLAAGVPQLIQPMGFDQYDNAWRLSRLGVGDELSPRRFAGPAVAEKLDRLLRSDGVAVAAAKWAPRCDREAALRQACEALENAAVASGR